MYCWMIGDDDDDDYTKQLLFIYKDANNYLCTENLQLMEYPLNIIIIYLFF